jgi:hypothetical protein
MFFQSHGRMQICTGLGYALIALFLTASVNESLADCRSDTVRTSNELVKLFAAGSLSVNTAKKLMGNKEHQWCQACKVATTVTIAQLQA